MAAFKFRLAPVLRYRRRIKEEKQWELRLHNEARRKMVEEIGCLAEELREAEQRIIGLEGHIYSVSELRRYGDYAASLEARMREKRGMLAAFEEKLNEKRAEVVEALRAVRTLEQLRKRLEDKFHRERDIAEQKLGDEIGRRRFVSASGGQKLP